jgi:hypothetical protein
MLRASDLKNKGYKQGLQLSCEGLTPFCLLLCYLITAQKYTCFGIKEI